MNCDWKYILFSTHHGMEPPKYECKRCGDKIQTDGDLPKRKCTGKYKKTIRKIFNNSDLSDEQRIMKIVKIIKRVVVQ